MKRQWKMFWNTKLIQHPGLNAIWSVVLRQFTIMHHLNLVYKEADANYLLPRGKKKKKKVVSYLFTCIEKADSFILLGWSNYIDSPFFFEICMHWYTLISWATMYFIYRMHKWFFVLNLEHWDGSISSSTSRKATVIGKLTVFRTRWNIFSFSYSAHCHKCSRITQCLYQPNVPTLKGVLGFTKVSLSRWCCWVLNYFLGCDTNNALTAKVLPLGWLQS